MNPYEVLGVSPNDDEETIKKAYRRLVKKYHPDRYQGSPLAEEASEKLKEINLAYDIITGKAQPQSNSSQGGYGAYSGGYTQNAPPSFQMVRTLITLHMLDAAMAMLNSLPQTAEWYYLMGVIYMNKGWYQKGREFTQKAAQMDPENPEYRNTQNSYSQRTSTYRSYGASISPLACCAASLCCSNLCNCRFFPCLCYC